MVVKCKRISDYSYFFDRNKESIEEAEQGIESGLNPAIKRELNTAAKYYAKDNAKGREAIGTYFVPAGSTSLFSVVKNGERAKTHDILKMSDGYDPVTGDCVREHKRSKTSKGYDVPYSPAKSFSVAVSQAEAMAASGNPNEAQFGRDLSDKLQSILIRANNRGMQFAYDEGYLEVRVTDEEGVTSRTAAKDLTAVQWLHFTSRAGDPQIHIHNVFFNSGRRPDGSTGTIDNNRLLKNIHSVNAVISAELAHLCETELGLSFHLKDRNVHIDGSPKSLEKNFSKRSEKVLELLKEEYGKEGRHEASAALLQMLVLKTRTSKDDLPPLEQLFLRWGLEAKAEGHNLFTILESMKLATEKKKQDQAQEWAQKVAEAKEQGIELPAERPRFDMEEIREKAFSSLTKHQATFEERELNAAILEQLSIHCSADHALSLLQELKTSDKIIEVGVEGRERVFSTPRIVGLEQDLLVRTDDMATVKESDRGVPKEIVEQIIAKGSVSSATGEAFEYKDEQQIGMKHFAGPQRFALINGSPGTGKSAMMDGYVRMERAIGRRVFGIAPTNRASIVLKQDAHIEAEHCRAVAGMIHDIESGKTVLSPNDVIICDEYGMVGLEDAAKLLYYVDQAGARFRGIGDIDQIQPVPFGAAMRSQMKVVDARFMVEISRQKGWQKDASLNLVKKDVGEAIGAYYRHGCIKHALSYEETIDYTVNRHFKVTDEHPGASHVVIARTNAEVREINDRIRDEKVARGELSTDSIRFAAMTRGQDSFETEIEVSVGDRVILGDNIKVGSDRLANNSFGTVRGIQQGVDGGEPRLTIEWENGFMWEGAPSELTNKFDEESVDKDGKPVPHLALAYAMTLYAAQGMTCDYSTMVNTIGMGIQTALVGMTRHRLGHEVVVDVSRIYDKLASKGGGKIEMGRGGSTSEQDHEPDEEVSEEAVREELVKECSQDESKKNVSDFQADALAWAKGETITKEVDLKDEPQQQKKEETKAEESAKAQAIPSFGRNRVRGIGQIGAAAQPAAQVKSAGDLLRERQAQRIANGEQRDVPRPRKPMPGVQKREPQRVPDEEMKELLSQDLAQYAEKELKLKADGVEEFGSRYFHWFQAPDGGYLSIEQRTEKMWTWVRRDGSAKGVIWDLVKEVKGGSIGRAIGELRDYFGTREKFKSSSSSTPRHNERSFRIPEAAPQTAAEKKTFVEKMRETRAVKWTEEKFAPIIDRFGKMKTVAQVGVSDYLLKRNIWAETQKAFGKDIRIEWSKSYLNPNGVAFPHKDLDGNLWTYERKGEKKDPRDKRSFSQMAGVAKEHADDVEQHRKRLGLVGNIEDPQRMYVAESQIDALSLYQLDKKAADERRGVPVPSEDKILLVSTYGNPSYRGLDDLSLLAERNTEAQIHVAMDNDRAGRHLSNLVHEAVKAGRGEDATIYERLCDPQFKDWNTQLMMKRRPDEIQAAWDSSVQAESRYLNSQGISVDLQKEIREDVRMEAKRNEDGNLIRPSIDGVNNAGGVMVALRDRDLHLTGYVRLGSEIDVTTAREFRRSESISQNGVVILGEHENPSVIYAGQSTMDLLKIVEKDGKPERFLILAAEAGADRAFNEEQKAVIQKFASEHPEVTWNFVPEGTVMYHKDPAQKVEQSAAEMRMAIREANPSVQLEERVSASMLEKAPEPKQPEQQIDRGREMEMQQKEAVQEKPEQAPKPEQDAQQAVETEKRNVPDFGRRPSQPAPAAEKAPTPEPDNSAAEAAAAQAAAQAAREEEERRRRSQGMSM